MDKERYWTFILYPESAKENWKQILQETGLVIGVSPLHDKDKNYDEEESQKKPHYHIMVSFNGPTTYRRVAKLTESVGGTIPKRILSPIGLIRYFTHKDNPEKYQYNEEDITGINGFNYKEFVGLSATQENAIKMAICKLIESINIKEYSDLIDYLRKNEMLDMFSIASDKVNFFNTYITSKRYKEEKEK